MFWKNLRSADSTVTIVIDGRKFETRTGDTVAAALLGAGFGPIRTSPVSGTPRDPHCMIGVCFECLVEIDGVSDQQACMVRVRHGMNVRRQLKSQARP